MKRVLVTGATAGIGRETARQLAKLGWHVYVHGRNAQSAQRAADELSESTQARLEPVFADLADMRAVLALAAQIAERCDTLDVLINNAGVFEHERIITGDGFELTMAVNHFAPFLLTQALLPRLRAAPRARIVTVSSMTHQGPKLDANDLEFSHRFDGYTAYSTSKLANILFTAELAKRLADSTVTANCLHPGVIKTKLLHKGWSMGGDSLTRGAKTSVHLATADELDQVSGRYFVDCRPAMPSPDARDGKLAAALWQVSADRLRLFLDALS